MTSWADRPFVSFDSETTGVKPLKDRIVTASVVTIDGASVTPREWLVDPGVEIPAGAAAIHRVTTEHARANGMRAPEAVWQIREALADAIRGGLPVVVFNAPYDLTLLAAECERYELPGLDELGAPMYVVDPLVIDRAVDPGRRGSGVRKLTYLCRNVYGVPLSEEDAHGSTADAIAAARVAWKIAKKYPQIGLMDIADLQVWQRDRHRGWAVDFGGWLASQGKVNDVEENWPARPLTTGT